MSLVGFGVAGAVALETGSSAPGSFAYNCTSCGYSYGAVALETGSSASGSFADNLCPQSAPCYTLTLLGNQCCALKRKNGQVCCPIYC